jgi:hypothetical protein
MGRVSGLVTNLAKSSMTIIHCSDDQIVEVATILSCQVKDLPLTYLGLLFSVRKPTKAQVQPMIDRLAKHTAKRVKKMLRFLVEGRRKSIGGTQLGGLGQTLFAGGIWGIRDPKPVACGGRIAGTLARLRKAQPERPWTSLSRYKRK